MSLKTVEIENGKKKGVFLPIDQWNLIKANYPFIETIDEDLPQWEKELIDKRLEIISLQPERLRPISELFMELKK